MSCHRPAGPISPPQACCTVGMRPPLLRALPPPRPSPQLLLPLPLRPVRWRGWQDPPPRPGTHQWILPSTTGLKATNQLTTDSVCDIKCGLKNFVLTKCILSKTIEQKRPEWCFPHFHQYYFKTTLFIYCYIFVLLFMLILLLAICAVVYSLLVCCVQPASLL